MAFLQDRSNFCSATWAGKVAQWETGINQMIEVAMLYSDELQLDY